MKIQQVSRHKDNFDYIFEISDTENILLNIDSMRQPEYREDLPELYYTITNNIESNCEDLFDDILKDITK